MDSETERQHAELVFLLHRIITTLEKLVERKEAAIEWLDNYDLCRLLKVTDRTLYRWRKQGLLKPLIIGGKCYYAKRQIDDLMDKLAL